MAAIWLMRYSIFTSSLLLKRECVCWERYHYVYFSGGRTAVEIANWLKKKTGPPAKDLTDKDAAAKLKEEEVSVIGFFKVRMKMIFIRQFKWGRTLLVKWESGWQDERRSGVAG